MEAKKRKIEESVDIKECCTCGESGSREVDEISKVKIRNKLLKEIIKDLVNISVIKGFVIMLINLLISVYFRFFPTPSFVFNVNTNSKNFIFLKKIVKIFIQKATMMSGQI